MNAADQAHSLDLTQAIAAVVALFRVQFPAARANLRPWRDDPLTRAFHEPDSLDFSLDFPGWSPRLQCRSLLVQLRLETVPGAGGRPRLLGVVVRGLTTDAERWRLATVGDWQPSGSHLPADTVVDQLRPICRQLFELFPGGRQEGGSAAA